MADTGRQHAELVRVLASVGDLAVAVSGGVDSCTLAVAAHRTPGVRATMLHAVSPAVPPEATARVQALAAREGWQLQILDAGEFDDPRYRANPADRCFYCKTHLYAGIARATGDQILSGANTDDLADWRPGLQAAAAHGVRHPYIEAGIGKAGVRALARRLGLGEVAELPASPCLSSRVETGIAIDADELALVHAVERLVGAELGAATVRCRVRRSGLVIELDDATFAALDAAVCDALAQRIAALCDRGRTIGFAPYRMGSAFLRRAAHV